ncbi:MAG: zinc ribbon domain-containing protein [bacterium]|nr:zinc ribbon domain-containing protein [bacterium]
MNRPNRGISEERKTAYYAGMAISGIGFLLFMVPFASVFLSIGTSSINPSGIGSAFGAGFIGFIMIAVGQVIRGIGARGLAGSGVLLDPEQARRDLEPYSRMSGGMMDDALSESDTVRNFVESFSHGGDDDSEPREVIKVRCRGCGALNDEDARFCDQCGAAM